MLLPLLYSYLQPPTPPLTPVTGGGGGESGGFKWRRHRHHRPEPVIIYYPPAFIRDKLIDVLDNLGQETDDEVVEQRVVEAVRVAELPIEVAQAAPSLAALKTVISALSQQSAMKPATSRIIKYVPTELPWADEDDEELILLLAYHHFYME